MRTIGSGKLLADDCGYRPGSVWMLLYVDDIILLSVSMEDAKDVKHVPMEHLDVKDLGSLKSFLGVLFGQDSDGGWLSQQHYITQVLHRLVMLNCKPVATPMYSGALKDICQSESVPADRTVYQELIGCLLFITTRTRPDIAAAVSILCRFSCAPTETHWICLKRLLRYLRGTKGHALRPYQEMNRIWLLFVMRIGLETASMDIQRQESFCNLEKARLPGRH